jgi:ribosomal protein S18 acetylase RimI-like enzyme
MVIRIATKEDLPFLQEMLREAALWRGDAPRPTMAEFLSNPESRKLLKDWGRPTDAAVVAEEDTEPVGAAWYRFWSDADHSWGYIAEDVPELGVAVAASHRSKGIGRALLDALIDEARVRGLRAVSLSVAPDNYARRLYESLGFTRAGESGTSWTYVLHLNTPVRVSAIETTQ